MKIIDLHCDTLLKIWEKPSRSFQNSEELDCNYERLKKGNVKVQFFAIFIEPFVKTEEKLSVALKQIQLFQSHILHGHQNVKWIQDWREIFTLKETEIGAVLTLEGAEAIGGELTKLDLLLASGVKSVGLTWNEANLCADGVMETRGAGLTTLGKKVIERLNEAKAFTDFSHLGETAFWETLERAKYPLVSHSNARAICNHPRNLSDEQISAIIERDGIIGLNFYPPFITGKNIAWSDDLLRHIEHICALGGERHLSFGSDFDGISYHLQDLRHAGEYGRFLTKLLDYFSEELVRGFAYENFVARLPK